MGEMRKILLASMAAALSMCCVPHDGYSCSPRIESNRKLFREATDIFVGQMTALSPDPSGVRQKTGGSAGVFKVEQRWKGANGGEIHLQIDDYVPCESFAFKVGESYLIYTYSFEGRKIAYASVATGSRSMAGNDEARSKQLRELNSRWFRVKARLWRF
jgi:hypothetical protein